MKINKGIVEYARCSSMSRTTDLRSAKRRAQWRNLSCSFLAFWRSGRRQGLDKLPLDIQRSTLPEALDVFPVLFQPVDNGVEDYVFPDDEHARFTFNGRVSPGDKRVLLKNDVCCLFVDKYRVLNY